MVIKISISVECRLKWLGLNIFLVENCTTKIKEFSNCNNIPILFVQYPLDYQMFGNSKIVGIAGILYLVQIQRVKGSLVFTFGTDSEC